MLAGGGLDVVGGGVSYTCELAACREGGAGAKIFGLHGRSCGLRGCARCVWGRVRVRQSYLCRRDLILCCPVRGVCWGKLLLHRSGCYQDVDVE